jgi:hypothetical protein
MKKKVFLAVALLALMTVGAFAQTYTAESNFQVTKTATAVTITRYVGGGSVPSAVNIPPTIQNLPVTTIAGNVFTSGMGSVTSLTIPSSVTSILATAFYNLANIRSVTFLGPIPRAGFAERAFAGDLFHKFYATDRNNGTPGTYTRNGEIWTLTPAAAPASTSMAETPATSFTWYQTSEGIGIESYTGTATTVRIPDRINNRPVVAVDDQAFQDGGTNNANITSVVIPNTVTKIGRQAFYRCSALTTVTLSTSLTMIDGSAFSGCTALTSISLPASITTIGGTAFRDCRALTTITIPASVTRITFTNNSAFQGATNVNAASKTALQRVGYTGSF